MNCKICNSESKEVFSAKVLNKYNVKYYQCPSCGFLQTEEPYWLDEAYKSAIGIADTGIQKRNQLFADRSSVIISSFFDPKKKFLDFAGGYGIFVRMIFTGMIPMRIIFLQKDSSIMKKIIMIWLQLSNALNILLILLSRLKRFSNFLTILFSRQELLVATLRNLTNGGITV